MKILQTVSGSALVTALGAIMLLAPSAQAVDKVRFQTDWIPSGEHAMYYGAVEKGIFAEQDIDVTISRGYGSGDTVTKLAANAFEFGVADIAAVMTARARQKIPVKAIAVVYNQSPHSLFVLKSSGITDFKGLEGKRIGITPGNSHKFYFPEVASRAGTDASKISWVNMDGAAMATQLIAKNLDAAPFYSIHHYYQNKAAEKAGEEILVLPFVKAGFRIFSASIITSDKMIKEKPELVGRFLTAIRNSFEWAKADPQEACELHVKRVPEVALDDCMGSLKATLQFVFNEHADKHGWGMTSKERLDFTWKVVASAQELPADWSVSQAVDTSLISK